MGYSGQSYKIPCDRGGLTANPNIDQISPEMMVLARNINIHENGRGTRGGTTPVNSTAVSGSPRITGIRDFTLSNGTQFIVFATNDGKIWKDPATTIRTTQTAGNQPTIFEVYKNKLYICNGVDPVQVWDGAAATTSALATVPSDWTGASQPKAIVKHGAGNSERLWSFLNNTVYASALGSDNFSNASVLTFNIETSDGSGILGMSEFGARLHIFSRTKTFFMNDTDANTANWGYQKSIYEGGAASHRLISVLPNDIVCMREDGNLYSVQAVQSYGDYKQASISRPAWIDKWIRDNVNLLYINDFHMVFDPVLRAIKLFLVRKGHITVDTALIYFIDRGPQEGWVIHDNQGYNSGYSASCSALVRAGAGNYRIYTGDYSGFLWGLEGSNYNDNGQPYYAGYKTARLAFDNARVNKQFDDGWLVTSTKGSWNVYLNVWIDGVQQSQKSVNLQGQYTWGTFVWGVDPWGGDEMIDVPFTVGNMGRRVQYEVFNTSANQPFFISKMLQDFKPLGAEASGTGASVASNSNTGSLSAI